MDADGRADHRLDLRVRGEGRQDHGQGHDHRPGQVATPIDFHAFVEQFWPQTIDGLVLGSIYALIALGYTLVYGVLRLINFAHSEVFMIGVFASFFALNGALNVTGAHTGAALALTLLVIGVASMAASGLAAVAIERVAYRPLRKKGAPRLAALISAIGMSFFLQELFALRYGREQIGLPRVIDRTLLFNIFDAEVRAQKLLVFVSAIVLMIALDRFVRMSRLGRGIRAVAQNAEVASLMGVDIDRVIMITFLLGGIMAGAAGMLFGVFFEVVRYNIGFLYGIKAFTAAVLGGIGNMRGALIGGFALGVLENWGSAVFGGQWKDVFAFSVLVAVLMFRPTGLFGESIGKARA